MAASPWLERARTAVGTGTLYWAGAGGLDPHAAHPASPLLLLNPQHVNGAMLFADALEVAPPLRLDRPIDYTRAAFRIASCDCSGFVCWVLGFARTTTEAPWSLNGETAWINTDAMWNDAGPHGAHARFEPLDAPLVGCLAVYPKPEDPAEPFGHVAFVSALDAQGKPARFIHCSGDNYRQHLDAILENYTDAFELHARTRYVWPAGTPRVG